VGGGITFFDKLPRFKKEEIPFLSNMRKPGGLCRLSSWTSGRGGGRDESYRKGKEMFFMVPPFLNITRPDGRRKEERGGFV